MKIKGNMNDYIMEFDSISDMQAYIKNTPLNSHFDKIYTPETVHSHLYDSYNKWYYTKNYEEAENLLVNGWHSMAEKLNTKFKKNLAMKSNLDFTSKNIISVAGSQAVVPLYLNNSPMAMMARQRVQSKAKVINLTKMISYNAHINSNKIIEESLKAFQIIRTLEAQGTRVNLFVAFAVNYSNEHINVLYRIKIKSAGERLNFSKAAFPLVNPSMLRRFIFALTERASFVPFSATNGYGVAMFQRDLLAFAKRMGLEKEYFIPALLSMEFEDIEHDKNLLDKMTVAK